MRRVLVIGLCFVLQACVWQPISYTTEARDSAESALAAFRSDERLQQFFAESVAIAVFPSSIRAGTGFGGAYGSGWLFEEGTVTGKVQMVEAFAGADLGVQAYRSVLFFRSSRALEKFKRGSFEFTGQANATAVTVGKSLTPSFNTEVALFTQVKAGLLLEASVGTQRYDYFPLAESSND